MNMTRRDWMKLGLGATALATLPRGFAQGSAAPAAAGSALPLITKAIPGTGEHIPVVGIGTRTYESLTAGIREVITGLSAAGCRMIDTADNYTRGASEDVIGQVVESAGIRDRVFIATKVNARGKDAGRANIEASFKKLRTDQVDLYYVHNLVDTDTQLATLKELKQAGRIRYIGISISSDNQYPELERYMRNEPLDFVQIDYAIDNRGVEDRVLPTAIERKIAVVTNLPFGRASLFRRVGDRALPDWAAEFDCKSWGQFFLKYNVSHPAITVAIPGTTQPRNLVDNVQGARGRLPDAATRTRMEQLIAAIPSPA
jgi:diketogulonate reductase-like aldo/keto reductase